MGPTSKVRRDAGRGKRRKSMGVEGKERMGRSDGKGKGKRGNGVVIQNAKLHFSSTYKQFLCTGYYYYYHHLYYFLTTVLNSKGRKIMLCKDKIRKQAGMVFTPPPPSQNYQEVE